MSIESNFDEIEALLKETKRQHTATIRKIAEEIISSYRQGGKVIIFGNGGSYADAIHFAAEFEGPFKNRDRPPLAALVPTNFSALTAISNDFGYDHTFKKFVEANARPHDLVIGISTSGNSPNVLSAMQEAKRNNIKTVAFTGETGGKMKDADILLNIPSADTARIQEMHQIAYHEICGIVEKAIFG